MKKHYYDKTNNNVFTITNFEYQPRENQDYEINEEQFIEFLDKRKKHYDIECDIVDNDIQFTYTKNTKSPYFLRSENDTMKKYLQATDYIIIKIYEQQALGNDISSLLEEYETEIALRNEYREKINENLKILNEMEAV